MDSSHHWLFNYKEVFQLIPLFGTATSSASSITSFSNSIFCFIHLGLPNLPTLPSLCLIFIATNSIFKGILKIIHINEEQFVVKICQSGNAWRICCTTIVMNLDSIKYYIFGLLVQLKLIIIIICVR